MKACRILHEEGLIEILSPPEKVAEYVSVIPKGSTACFSVSRYVGKCARCKKLYGLGDSIAWVPSEIPGGKTKSYHETCYREMVG